ncbi:acetyl-CoA acetyltransferase [Sandaracinobacter sp. RS1-74]|uniref:acetyl-CoA acetyltransferase n=1 Tax=Sandaracinobacteroides sayramensis TaxID=2913411 RepID=UPI001EDB3C65|nr:acetyl-CoA acetyltransferase [Sandaracinobacteroides sayramensis]MCG2840708.1 acetyl-CoA acetyltransferase [Sandaracinobacteroides sayramensis]
MKLDPRTPVLVGVAQSVDRVSAPGQGLSPQEMMAAVARAAIADSGGRQVEAAIDAVAVVRLFQDSGFGAPFGRQDNLPWSVARRIGASPKRMLYGPVGGNSPQMLVNVFAEAIGHGEQEVVLLAGCEPIRSQARALKAGLKLDWAEEAPEPAEEWPEKTRYASEHEMRHGLALPVNIYPLFENALGQHYGRTPLAHRRAIGALMARFTEVAAENPYAQLPVARTAEEIITPEGDNRYIGYPYTKYLNANMFVDQAAALLLMSTAAADRLGVPQAKRVYLHGSADTQDKILLSERVNYWSSPAIAVGARAALKQAGIGTDAIGHMDLYSCFPSAVEIAADAIGLRHDDSRGLTLTGGLPYFGGPGNNYAMHGIAEVAALCRAIPGQPGFLFANGGYLTKHSFGVWSTAPRPFERRDPAGYQAEIDAMESPPFTEKPSGRGVVETFTVVHDKGNPAFALLIGRLEGRGTRFLAQIHDNPGALVDVPVVGQAVEVRAGDAVNLARLV